MAAFRDEVDALERTMAFVDGPDDDDDEDMEEANWRSEGSEYLERRIRRSVEGGKWVDGVVRRWLPAAESNFYSPGGDTVALYRVEYDAGWRGLRGDVEDLEERELHESFLPSDAFPVDDDGVVKSDYERLRDKNIERNRAVMEALGLPSATPKKKTRKRPQPQTSTRSSARIREIKEKEDTQQVQDDDDLELDLDDVLDDDDDEFHDLDDDDDDDDDDVSQQQKEQRRQGSSAAAAKAKHRPEEEEEEEEGDDDEDEAPPPPPPADDEDDEEEDDIDDDEAFLADVRSHFVSRFTFVP